MIIENINDLTKFDTVMQVIEDQFQAIMQTDPKFYENYEFEIRNEQYFIPDDERNGHKIFIVVKFLPAELYYEQDVLPVTIQATSECNGVAAAQRLLFEYAQVFNLNTLEKDDKIIYQNYTSPNVISNFEVIYDGYRSLLVMSGTFLISRNVNRIKLKYYDGNSFKQVETVPSEYVADLIEIVRFENDEVIPVQVYKWVENKYKKYNGEDLPILNYTDTFDATPDTQPYFEKKNFTESIIKYGTFSFNAVSYLLKNNFNTKILKIIARRKKINSDFYFKIIFDDDECDMPLLPYKLLNATKQQNVGEFPSIVTAFTN